MLINPVQPVVELWLAIYNCFPAAFHAYFNLVLGILAATSVVSMIWHLR